MKVYRGMLLLVVMFIATKQTIADRGYLVKINNPYGYIVLVQKPDSAGLSGWYKDANGNTITLNNQQIFALGKGGNDMRVEIPQPGGNDAAVYILVSNSKEINRARLQDVENPATNERSIRMEAKNKTGASPEYVSKIFPSQTLCGKNTCKNCTPGRGGCKWCDCDWNEEPVEGNALITIDILKDGTFASLNGTLNGEQGEEKGKNYCDDEDCRRQNT